MDSRACCLVSAMLLFAASSGAAADSPAPVSHEEARTLALPALTERILGQLGATVVSVRRPRPDQADNLVLATRPISVMPGLCETQLIEVTFVQEPVRSSGSGNAIEVERNIRNRTSHRLSMVTAYRVVGDLYPDATFDDPGEAFEDSRCANDPTPLTYFKAPSYYVAEIAARVVKTFAIATSKPGGVEFKLTCGRAACTDQLVRLSAISPANIWEVSAPDCRDRIGSTGMCLSISVFEPGIRQSARSPGSVERRGWTLDVTVIDKMINTDVITFSDFQIQSVEANPFLMTGSRDVME